MFCLADCVLADCSMFIARAISKATNESERWGGRQFVDELQPNLLLGRRHFQSRYTDHKKLVKNWLFCEEVAESSEAVFWIEGPYILFESKCLTVQPPLPLISTCRKFYSTRAQHSSRASKRAVFYEYASGQWSFSKQLLCTSPQALSFLAGCTWTSRVHSSLQPARGASASAYDCALYYCLLQWCPV